MLSPLHCVCVCVCLWSSGVYFGVNLITSICALTVGRHLMTLVRT